MSLSSGVLLVSTTVNGVRKICSSPDLGVSWVALTHPYETTNWNSLYLRYQDRIGFSGWVLTAKNTTTGDVSVAVSTDDGLTWTKKDLGVASTALGNIYMDYVATTQQWIVIMSQGERWILNSALTTIVAHYTNNVYGSYYVADVMYHPTHGCMIFLLGYATQFVYGLPNSSSYPWQNYTSQNNPNVTAYGLRWWPHNNYITLDCKDNGIRYYYVHKDNVFSSWSVAAGTIGHPNVFFEAIVNANGKYLAVPFSPSSFPNVLSCSWVDSSFVVSALGNAPTMYSGYCLGLIYHNGNYYTAYSNAGKCYKSATGLSGSWVEIDIGNNDAVTNYLMKSFAGRACILGANGRVYSTESLVLSGVVRDGQGNPCRRKICVYRRSNMQLLATVYSDATTGQYSLNFLDTNELVRIVFADDAAEGIIYNDIIDRVKAN